MLTPSRAERLQAILTRVNPEVVATMTRTRDNADTPSAGDWGALPYTTKDGATVRPPDTHPAVREASAPYIITERGDGTWSVQVKTKDADLLGAIGASIDEALTRLAAKAAVMFPD